MNCEKCGYEIDDIEECDYEITNSGTSFNWTYEQTEYWFEADVTCPECGHIFEYSDTSL